MDTSRKRAAIACNLCRRRKRRCNGEKPACSLCQDVGVECSYVGGEAHSSVIAQDPDLSTVISRLAEIEVLLQRQSQALSNLPTHQPHQQAQATLPISHVSTPNTTGPPTTFIHDSPASIVPHPLPDIQRSVSRAADFSATSPSSTSEVNLPPMAIPLGHLTTTGSLLESHKLQALVGEFPRDLFLDIEIKRPIPAALLANVLANSILPAIDIDCRSAGPSVQAFLSTVHVESPILDIDNFLAIYNSVLENGLRQDLGSALCLMCIALGEVVQSLPAPSELADPDWAPGAKYLAAALPILTYESLNSFGTSIVLCQALYFTAKYFGFLARPLQSWRYAHMASTHVQHFSGALEHLSPSLESTQAIIRVAWAIFDLECDLIAEHHLPRSGIEHLIDILPLPECGASPTTEVLCWLAELSVRRLLNRVHYLVYKSASKFGVSVSGFNLPPDTQAPNVLSLRSLMSISAELDRQLETWFDLLPLAIKPDLARPSTWSLDQINILCRYYSAKDIIFRPFVMYICNLSSELDIPEDIRDNARRCLASCRAYLDLSERRLRTSCSFGEIIMHSTFASAIVLTMASLCPSLKSLVLDIENLQGGALTTIRRLAFGGSCVEFMLWILEALRAKAKISGRVTRAL